MLTVIELIWTISPAIVLIFIAFPSFKLLFLVDDVPNACITVNVTGLILFGLILYIISKIKDDSDTIEKNNTFQYNDVFSNRLAQVKGTGKINTKIYNRSFHTSSRASKRIGPHNEDVISVIIGSLLGDAYANSRTIEGVRFCYRQSIIHQKYLFFLYSFFNDRGYCSNLAPRKYTRKLINKTTKEVKEYFGYEFNTYTFSSLKWIHNLFYKKGIKFISPKLEQYLTPLALAIWIMDCGYNKKNFLYINTKFQDIKDVKLLVNILIKNFGINCSIINNKDTYYGIKIAKSSIGALVSLIKPHMNKILLNIMVNFIDKKNKSNEFRIEPSKKSNLSPLFNKQVSSRFYSTSCNNINLKEDSNLQKNNLFDIYQKFDKNIIIYSNLEEDKSIIYKENKDKSGIYMFLNKKTGNYYIGSSKNLGKRFSGYLAKKFLEREILRTKSKIYSALLKYGYNNFELIILEYCDITVLINKEQHYIDFYKPYYNILKIAGSSIGFKHSEETLIKFRNRELTEEHRENLKNHLQKLNIELNKKKSIKVEIFDLYTNINHSYDSIRDAAKAINSNIKTFNIQEKNNKDNNIIPYRGRYVITILRKEMSWLDYKKIIELGRNNMEIGLMNFKNSLGRNILVNNIQTNEIIEYNSISEVAKFLKITRRTVNKRLEDGKLVNEIYEIKYKVSCEV